MGMTPEKLRQVVVLQNATDDDLQEIIRNSVTRSIEEGEFFFFQGDLSDYLYILTEGQFKLLQSNPIGQQVNLRTIYPWQMFGALGVAREEANYPATAQAIEDSSALAISSKVFKDMLLTRPYLAAGLM